MVAPAAIAIHVRQLVEGARRAEDGHFYLPPPPMVGTHFAFELDATYLENLSASLAFLFDQVNGLSDPGYPSVRFAVIHRQRDKQLLDPPIARPVDTWVVSPVLSTQRRRMTRFQLT